jgi:spermidine synthase
VRALVPVPFLFVAALFFASGATGLVYEVAFSKSLAPLFGATAYAVSAVLAAFMGGLAIGAHAGGRLASRSRRPLLAYGVAEIAVGLISAGTPWAFAAIERVYVSLARASHGSLGALTVARAGLAFTAIVVPTICMGATLPLLARVTSSDRAALPRLYAINTAGGALGSLLGAYAVLPWLGLTGAMRGAAAVNVAIGVLAILRSRSMAPLEPEAEEVRAAPVTARDDGSGADRTLGAIFAFASGFLVFAAEVVETHLLTVLIGNSAYAFGLMLAVFLVCLAAGAAVSRRLERKHGPASLGRGLVLAALGLAITIPLWDQLPPFFAFAGKHVGSWAGREACRAVAAAALLALSTVLMGTTFPLLLARAAKREGVAREVGRLVSINTAGTIAGSIATGYVVLPALGSQRALVAVACAFALLGVVAARVRGVASAPEPSASARRTTWAIGAAAALVAVVVPTWNLARLTNGANVYFAYGPPPDRIEMVREDVHGGVTTVAVRGDVTTMYTNGKFQGDDGPEMVAQRRFAHFPGMFLRSEKRALVIGLGTGVTLGTVAAYPFERIDVAEISPAIVEASRRFYADESFFALDDPRVKLHHEDGRSLLLVETEPYDLVTIELTSVWFAGAASLYSKEFYELTRSRLTEGGVLQQWVQLHHLRPRELGVIIRTLHAVFPHVALFLGGEQGILVASASPLEASSTRLAKLDQDPKIRATLGGKTTEQLLDELVASDTELVRLAEDLARDGGPILSTDDNLYLEVETPKGNVLPYRSSLEASLALLERYRTPEATSRHLRP